jgi:lipopolysaccharide heptosyltransferase II
MQKILVIQTAFIGDAILASAMLETLHKHLPKAAIHLMVRKGNESLYNQHPYLKQVWVWNKKDGKYRSLIKMLSNIRKEKFDTVINLQRFGATGFLTAFSRSKQTIGFSKNPFARFFTDKVVHEWGNGTHEIERNNALLAPLLGKVQEVEKPKLYPTEKDVAAIQDFMVDDFVCMAPTSVWFTKQFPAKQWIDLCNDEKLANKTIYLLGAPADKAACDEIIAASKHTQVVNLCGKLNLLQSAALMQQATMNYVNDSAPMHLCSSMNAPVTAIYCSTIPAFGFGPLSDSSHVVETKQDLDCRPCGMHGFKSCPKGHFNCAKQITTAQLVDVLG